MWSVRVWGHVMATRGAEAEHLRVAARADGGTACDEGLVAGDDLI